ncbi:cytochrome P450 [Streptomyces rimosus]
MTDTACPHFPFPDAYGPHGIELHPAYHWARSYGAAAPVTLATGHTGWLITRHDAALQILRDPRFSVSAAAHAEASAEMGPTPPETFGIMTTFHDAGLRSPLLDAVNARQAAHDRPRIEALANHLLDQAEARSRPVDLYQDYALPLPLGDVCRILGITLDDVPDGFADWEATSLDFTSTRQQLDDAWQHQFAWARTLLRNPPPRGLLRPFSAAALAHGGTEPDERITWATVSLITAGHMSATVLIANSLITLLTRPHLIDRLRRDPALWKPTVDELLRYTPFIHSGLPRLALEDVRLGDTTIRAGDYVVICIEGTNRDPRECPNPDTFDPTRQPPTKTVTFGHGPNTCPAAALGRLHVETALRVLLDRHPTLRLTSPPQHLPWRTTSLIRTVRRLPVHW